MKLSFSCLLLIITCPAFSQPAHNDTLQAKKYFERAVSLEQTGANDSALVYATKAQEIYLSAAGEKSISNANSLHLLGRLNYNLSNYDTALYYNYRAVNIRKALLGNDHPDVARSYFNLGLIRYYSGNPEKALPEYLEALRIRQKSLPSNHNDLARSYYNLGKTYFDLADLDRSLDCFLHAAEITKVVYGPVSEDAAQCSYDIGTVYFKKGNYDLAIESLLEALKIRKNISNGNNAALASTYDMIGNACSYSGKYDSAMENFLISLQMRKALFGENNADVAGTYLNIGNVYYFRGDYRKVPDFYKKATDIYVSLLGENDPSVAAVLNNMGVVCWQAGEYDRAVENDIRSLNIRKKLFGENHPVLAENYINTGLALRSKGDLDNALFYYLKIPGLFQGKGNETPVLATAYAGMGAVYVEKGESNRGLEYLLRAAEIRKNLLGEAHPEMAEINTSIGAAYFSMHEYERALAYYLDAVKILQQLFGENHSSIAEVYSNIGILFNEAGKPDEALKYHYKAIEISREALGENHPSVGRNYNNAGISLSRKGDYDCALDYYSKSLKNTRAVYGEKHPLVAQVWYNIAMVYEAKTAWDAALKFYQKAAAACSSGKLDTLDLSTVPLARETAAWRYMLEALNKKALILADTRKHLGSIPDGRRKSAALNHYRVCDTIIDITRKNISSLDDKLALGSIANQVCKQAVDLLTAPVGGMNRAKIPASDAETAFYFSEKNKSSVLLEALAGQEAQHFAGIPDSLLRKELDLKKRIAFCSGRLAGAGLADSAEARTYRDLLFRSNMSLDSIVRVFELQYPGYHNLKYNTYCRGAGEIRKLLDSRTALISYFTGDSTITIFTLTKKSSSVTRVPMIENLADSIGWLRYGLINTSPRMQRTYARLGYKLYRQLFPERLLDDQVENIIIIPDGELSLIPFEVLLTRYPGDFFGKYESYPYLVRKYNISYSYSANLFYLSSKQKSEGEGWSQLKDFVALAPVFETNPERQVRLETGELNRELGWLRTDSALVKRSLFNMRYVAPLPATKNETEAIAGLFSDKRLSAKVLLYDEASEKFIKSPEASQYRILHFATHGFINSEKPEFSGLLLSGDSASGEDGILYAGEIYNLRLNAGLIVLSACETGLGRIQKGEGIIGLTRALLYAGGKNIIVSLWQVADESTSQLMIDFYRNLLVSKMTNSEALRQARLTMINENRYSHPMYWSPFILIGR